jgi:uncharacterized iron-regulated membrane protein
MLHRYCGIAMAAFLVVVGLTGSLLAFNSELERVFAPQLFAMPRSDQKPLELAELASRAESLVANAMVRGVAFTETDQVKVTFEALTDPVTNKPFNLAFNQLFVDPWTGLELGRRMRGDLSEGKINLMPFIYDLHWRLSLGKFGQWTLGIVALIWTVDCFNGFYLTLPLARREFWRRWRPAWVIKRNASVHRLNFDIHRAGGLWLLLLLLVFAWSSVMMNIRDPVYDWVTKMVFSDYQSPLDEFKSARAAMTAAKDHRAQLPVLDWHEAQEAGSRLVAEQAKRYDFTFGSALGLTYNSALGTYTYEVRGSRDVFERAPKGGSTSVTFDGNTGALVKLHRPTGEHAGNTVESWLYALHMARVFGRPYQLFVCLFGVAVAVLSVTGIVIWVRKRRAGQVARYRRERVIRTGNVSDDTSLTKC